MTEKYLIYGAKLFSILFAPFYFSILACLIMFVFSYMKMLPLNYQLMILGIVYIFTIAMPLSGIALYRKLSGLRRHQMTKRELRFIPYNITLVCYACCLVLLENLHIPHIMISILACALVVELVCAIIAAGAMNGALLAFSLIFNFNPIWWLCLTLLISGMVGSSRIILRQHTLSEVNWGTLIGTVCGFVTILIV